MLAMRELKILIPS
jgi:hypothetical protein